MPQAKDGTKDTTALPHATRSLSGIADQAEKTLHQANRRVLWGMAVAVVIALVLAGSAFVVSVSTARSESATAAAERVGERTQAGRNELGSANTARFVRGLPPFPDPGATAGPDLVWLAAARAWQSVDAADVAAAGGGVPGPGVSTPAPSGRFPGRSPGN